MKITPEQVRSVANLARVAIADDKVQQLSNQLSEMVAYVEQLNELDTSGVEPTSHAVPMVCPTRPDVTVPSDLRDGLLGQAPKTNREHFSVPRVIE